MTEWTVKVSDQTDRAVRQHLSQSMGDLSTFVDQAVRQKVFRETVKAVKERNAGLDQDAIMKLVEEAVDDIRALGD